VRLERDVVSGVLQRVGSAGQRPVGGKRRLIRFRAVEPRPRELPLDPECSKRSASEPEPALVEEIAWLPAGKELRVEAVQALDLEVAVEDGDDSAEQPLAPAVRVAERVAERGEVER